MYIMEIILFNVQSNRYCNGISCLVLQQAVYSITMEILHIIFKASIGTERKHVQLDALLRNNLIPYATDQKKVFKFKNLFYILINILLSSNILFFISFYLHLSISMSIILKECVG